MNSFRRTLPSLDSFVFFERLGEGVPDREALFETVGVNYDTCHLAVEYEEPGEALTRLSEATHLAAALGTPTVALFGPSDPAGWAPRGPSAVRVLHAPLAELPPQRVLEALREIGSQATPRSK